MCTSSAKFSLPRIPENYWSLLLLVFIFAYITEGVSAQIPQRTGGPEPYNIYQSIEVLEDSEGKYSIDDVVSPALDGAFLPHEGGVPSYSYTRSAYWFRFELGELSDTENWVLEVAYPMIQDIEFYYPEKQGVYTKVKTGASYPFEMRPYEHRNFVLPLPTRSSEQAGPLYLRAQSETALILPMKLWEEDDFLAKTTKEYIIQGIYYGMVIIMALYNLFLFMFVRERKYLYHILYIVSAGFFHLSLNGLAHQYLWPRFPWWANRSLLFFKFSGSFFLLQFAGEVLNLRYDLRPSYKAVKYMAGFALIMLPGTLFLPYTPVMLAGIATVFIGSLVLILAVINSWSKKQRTARYIFVAWIFLLGGAFLLSGRSMGIFPHSVITLSGIQFGSALEMIFLSLSLADTTYMLNREKERANELARKDELTGLFNRRAFFDIGEKLFEPSRSEGRPLSLLMMDIDHFKTINDEYGHMAGDRVLRILAQRLVRNLRESDYAARYGGEEFCILLVSTGKEDAVKTADTIREMIEKNPIILKSHGRIRITVSLGVAFLQDEPGFGQLVEKADNALYAAKKRGRNTVAVADEGLNWEDILSL